MGRLVIGSRSFGMSDDALKQLMEMLSNAFEKATPVSGLWLKFGVYGDPASGHTAVWVSPSHDISMEFDFPLEPRGPEIFGVDPDGDAAG